MPDIESPVCDLQHKRILLINPPWSIRSGNVWKSVASCYPALGLALIGSYMEHCGAEVEIIDMQAQSGDTSILASTTKPDLVGITATTVIFSEAIKVAEIVRDLWKDVSIVMGGVHPTIAPWETFKSGGTVDYVIRGEGERSLAMLAGGEPTDRIPGLAMVRDGNAWQHPATDCIENLNAMPLPAYHLLPMDKYHPPLGGTIRLPAMSMLSSRGCPGMCTYCNSSLSQKLRFRSAENVVSEIETLASRYGIREIGFYDDTFCASPERVWELCQHIIDRNIDIAWTCMSRINFADTETLGVMARSGCHMICYGIESANETIRKNIRKGINIRNVKPVVAMTRAAGISTRLSFMFGSPGETLETMQETLEFAIRVDPDLVQFNITTPYPGTEMFKWAEENGYILHRDWSRYDLQSVVMRLPTVTPEETISFLHYAYRKFFLRWRFIRRQTARTLKHPLILKQFLAAYISLARQFFHRKG